MKGLYFCYKSPHLSLKSRMDILSIMLLKHQNYQSQQHSEEVFSSTRLEKTIIANINGLIYNGTCHAINQDPSMHFSLLVTRSIQAYIYMCVCPLTFFIDVRNTSLKF